MKQKASDLMLLNNVLVWIAIATGAVLLIPLIAMQFTTEVQWEEIDFVVMGSLLFGTASLFVMVARKTPRRHRLLIGALSIAVFLYLWAELAVGVFSN